MQQQISVPLPWWKCAKLARCCCSFFLVMGLYDTDKHGRAMNFKSENSISEKWKRSWNKKKKTTRMEATEGMAAGVMIKFGNIAPLWTGVLKKAFIWLVKDMVSQERKKFIKKL